MRSSRRCGPSKRCEIQPAPNERPSRSPRSAGRPRSGASDRARLPLPAREEQAALPLAVAHDARKAAQGERERRLRPVGEPRDVRGHFVLRKRAEHPAALREGRHGPRLVARRLRDRPDPERQVRDHAERVLRAEHEPVRSGPAAEPGAPGGASSPAGVTQRTAATRSSKRPKPVEAWPAKRVAAQPPAVAHS